MVLELELLKGRQVLFKIPIREKEGQSGYNFQLDDNDIETPARLYAFAANERRLRLMLELTKRSEMKFSNLLQLTTNSNEPVSTHTCSGRDENRRDTH